MRSILFLVLNLAAIILIVFLIKDFVTSYKGVKKRPILIKKILKLTILFAVLIALPLVIVDNLSEEPQIETEQEKIDFYTKYKRFIELSDVYYDQLYYDPLNLDLHFKHVNSINLFIQETSDGGNLEWLLKSNRSTGIIDYYQSLTDDPDTVKKDIGYTFLGLYHINLKEFQDVYGMLDNVSDTSNIMYKFTFANYLEKSHWSKDYRLAERLLYDCISDSINVKESYDILTRLYYYHGKDKKLKELVDNPETLKYMREFTKRMVYLRELDIKNYSKTVFSRKTTAISIWGGLAALMILITWIIYLRKVDIYEPEKWSHTLITLFLSMGTLFLIYPIHDILWDKFHFFPGKNATEDFIYDFFTIGVVEELVKIIPVLIILRFTKAINEPFDYIYYCSISALGFAFIENIGYIQEHSLHNINGRALMASVAHMIFSSTIGYGIMLAKYKKYKYPIIPFLIFFSIAAVMHTFYDLWLLHEWALGLEWITTMFFIFSVHLWHLYANNTLNITTFYNPKTKFRNDKLKQYLIVSLVGILMYSYVAYAFTQGKETATESLIRQLLFYGYFILYLAFSFSRFEIIRGYLAPFNIPLTLLIPRIKRTSDLSGLPTKISTSSKFRLLQEYSELKKMLPSNAQLEKRIVLDDNLESYVAKLEKPISMEGFLTDIVIIMPQSKKRKLNDSGNMLVHLFLIESIDLIEKPVLSKEDFHFAGWAISRKLS